MTTTGTSTAKGSLRGTLLNVAKSGWVLLVFGGVIVVLATNWQTFSEQLRTIAWWRIMLSSAALIGGKLLLAAMSRQSVQVTGADIAYPRMFMIYSMSQLAKYLPGGVWHYVGRAGYYAASGLNAGQVTRAMVVDNLWLVTSACFTGGIAFALYAADERAIFAPVLFGLWVILLLVMTRWRVPDASWHVVGRALLLQAAIWTLLGAALWALIPLNTPRFGLLAIGAFGLSWAIGYVTIFAPSGLGVREAVLAALLGLVMSPAAALVYAALNRIVWVLTELLLGLITRHPYFNR